MHTCLVQFSMYCCMHTTIYNKNQDTPAINDGYKGKETLVKQMKSLALVSLKLMGLLKFKLK